ncbi:hypothetical protein Vadar_005524 [Vaccinium darrowii]|uniref:Uncharacterized protein n=1 Tax=Vaccinium darrowii TaxID=229202 RepID=A0ACB7XXP4_9ERIC|nr:hypothetical protein Vadar_005524 [Vaccinium darrowii]
MKGKYLEGKDHHANTLFTSMHHNFKHHNQQQPLQTHHFHLSQTSEDQESSVDRTDTRTQTKDVLLPGPAAATNSSNDGATIEVVRRPRGRPPGSKNKPKPPLIITHQPDLTGMMNPYVLEIPTGLDLIHSITQFSQKRSTAVCVLSATGPVSNVTLRQPTATVTFQGRFDMLSLSATVFPSPTTMTSSLRGTEFRISLGGPQGMVVGGTVVGPLFAADTVYVVAASFNNPSFHRLPLKEEEEELSGSGGNNEGRSVSPPVGHGGGDGGHAVAAAVGEACGVPFYTGGRLGEEMVWAPIAARPPPPPHY